MTNYIDPRTADLVYVPVLTFFVSNHCNTFIMFGIHFPAKTLVPLGTPRARLIRIGRRVRWKLRAAQPPVTRGHTAIKCRVELKERIDVGRDEESG